MRCALPRQSQRHLIAGSLRVSDANQSTFRPHGRVPSTALPGLCPWRLDYGLKSRTYLRRKPVTAPSLCAIPLQAAQPLLPGSGAEYQRSARIARAHTAAARGTARRSRAPRAVRKRSRAPPMPRALARACVASAAVLRRSQFRGVAVPTGTAFRGDGGLEMGTMVEGGGALWSVEVSASHCARRAASRSHCNDAATRGASVRSDHRTTAFGASRGRRSSPVPAQHDRIWNPNAVRAQVWQRREPSPGADVAAARAQSRGRCGSGASPVPVQMWQRREPSPGADVACVHAHLVCELVYALS